MLGGAYRNIKGLLYYITKWLQSSVICHEAAAMILFLSKTVYSPMFTARVEVTVETLRIWVHIHLQKHIQPSCWYRHISYWSEKTSLMRRQTVHDMRKVPKFLRKRDTSLHFMPLRSFLPWISEQHMKGNCRHTMQNLAFYSPRVLSSSGPHIKKEYKINKKTLF